ncbi:hypothetical protein HYS94_02070 [Candidatus Daviesbacteria bacterium]|nr:hypothetical protein [Candidatus Daviesbacteria bacterium]
MAKYELYDPENNKEEEMLFDAEEEMDSCLEELKDDLREIVDAFNFKFNDWKEKHRKLGASDTAVKESVHIKVKSIFSNNLGRIDI